LAASSQPDFELRKRSNTPPISAFDFLRACCPRPAEGGADLANCLRSSLDWDAVLKLATHHRVLPSVHEALHGRDDAPASIRAAADARFSSHSRRVLRFSALLAGILRQFKDHGIEVLPHKGPVLAQQLYGNPAMRDFGDLDFLVRTADVPRARTALQDLGYMPRLTLSSRQHQEYRRIGYEYVFGSAAEPNVIELQWQIVPRFYSIATNLESLFPRSVECQFEGMRVRTLCNEDLMLALCVHAAKHEWFQLGMVRDIAALARLELDWQWIMAEAVRLGIQRIVTVSLELARTLLGLELPQNLAHPAKLNGEALASDIRDRMSRAQEPATDSIRYFRSMMNLRERWRDRVRFAWRLAFTPTISEWQAVSLPDQLFPIYRVVRVLRLAKRGWRGITSRFRKPDRR
jgi:Uncharacterised nucleotidyltransferase